MAIDYLSKISSLGSIPSGQDAIDALQNSSLANIAGVSGNPLGGINQLKSLGPTATNLANQASGSATAVAESATTPSVSTDGTMPTVVVPGKRAPKDFRVRLGPPVSMINQIYGENTASNILTPLRLTQGLMFPFTPTIDWGQSVQYKTVSLIHSLQDFNAFEETPSTNISVSGTFVIQNDKDARYMLACLHFLRTVSKMYFGKASFTDPAARSDPEAKPSLAGMPPPVLIFSGYGDYMFNDLPVILKDHSYTFKQDVSYIDFEVNGSMVRLPSILDISLKLVVQNSPKRLKDEFDLDKFRTGALMKNKGWI